MRPLPLPDPGTPVTRSPGAFLWWLLRGQLRTILGGAAFGIAWMVLQALLPFALGRGIDAGVRHGDSHALTRWSLVLFGLGIGQALAGVIRHRFAVTNFLVAASRVQQLVARHAAHLGADAQRDVAAGEIAVLGASDVHKIGSALDVTARLSGAVVSYVVVALLLLDSSVVLGLVVLLGVPLLLAAVTPVVRPLEAREGRVRELLGEASDLAGDTVAGLRVLRGVGGEETAAARFDAASQRVRVAAVRAARLQSAVDALQVLLPGLFVVTVTWLGARFALAGRITPGELVSFYAASAFLVLPLRTATEAATKLAGALVAARRVITMLERQRRVAEPADPITAPDSAQPLRDSATGLVVTPGRMTAVASSTPELGSALAERLGRYVTTSGVTFGDVSLDDVSVADVRARILVCSKDAGLLSGPVRETLDPPRLGPGVATRDAIHAASAEDVIDALSDGLDTELTERGRSLSGGQRQRLALARALVADPDVLVLDDPTSAVDAYTEAQIAGRLKALRHGRTTVVVTTSPLLLDRADQVVLIDADGVVAAGTHRTLLAEHPAYGDAVGRAQ